MFPSRFAYRRRSGRRGLRLVHTRVAVDDSRSIVALTVVGVEDQVRVALGRRSKSVPALDVLLRADRLRVGAVRFRRAEVGRVIIGTEIGFLSIWKIFETLTSAVALMHLLLD